ncbi:hypothetical protein O181_007724 [Austropuccinia psidii MF-1]|uniref:Uncharacterized protein n=1 Tax=Austropuccinia psidii MF-1 TaxID=1389203 RepID=A0A9Q3GI60_9BASI|nr:hypothetical protein [Austropuccinia psidii MF-1]
MGELKNENYLAVSRAPIDESEDEKTPSTKKVQGKPYMSNISIIGYLPVCYLATISKVKGHKRISAHCKKQNPLNQTTLEIQDQSKAIELITSNNISPTSETEDDTTPSGKYIPSHFSKHQ